jgi:hypothetical protein
MSYLQKETSCQRIQESSSGLFAGQFSKIEEKREKKKKGEKRKKRILTFSQAATRI